MKPVDKPVFLLLEFPPDEAADADPALAAARNMPGFDRRFLPERRATLRLPLEKAAAWRDSLFELWEMVRLRPGAALRVNNADVDDNGLKDVLHVHDCSRGHTDAKHCSPLHGWDWGCLFLAHMLPEARETDGDALRARLEKEAARLHLTLCPHFSADVLAAKAAEICRNTGRNPASPKPAPDIRSTSGAGEKQAEKTRVRPARYADIGGLDNAVRALREEVELPLRHPEILRHLGIMPSRGCLLHGPPGCGKTLLARALATESSAAFIPINGPELVTKWHGESEEKLRDVFARARKAQPAIIFFDEIDAIAQSRSSAESLRLDAKFTAQLLTLMDGVQDGGRVFILGATNRLDLLDSALLRPGRFDKIIPIGRPDAGGRAKILAIHARGLPLANSVDFSAMAARLAGYTGAELAFLVREAAYAALRRMMPLDMLLRSSERIPDESLRSIRVTREDFTNALHVLRNRPPQERKAAEARQTPYRTRPA